MSLMPSMVPRPQATVDFIAATRNNSGSNSYSFTGQTVVPGKLIVIVGFSSATSSIAVTGITVDEGGDGGPVAMTYVKHARGSTNTNYRHEIWELNGIVDVSATIAVALSASVNGIVLETFVIKNGSAAPHATASQNGSATLATILDVPAGGVAIASAYDNDASAAAWTGLTERIESMASPSRALTAAADAFKDFQDDLAIQVVLTGGVAIEANLAAASWGPA